MEHARSFGHCGALAEKSKVKHVHKPGSYLLGIAMDVRNALGNGNQFHQLAVGIAEQFSAPSQLQALNCFKEDTCPGRTHHTNDLHSGFVHGGVVAGPVEAEFQCRSLRNTLNVKFSAQQSKGQKGV